MKAQYSVCPCSHSLAFANLPIKDGYRGTEMQVHLTADISQAEVQMGDSLAESPIFLGVLSSWVMFPLKLIESICYNRCVYVNELSPEIWKWPHGGLSQVEITEIASFWISPSVFLKHCELEMVWREDKEQNKCCLSASLYCRCTLKQDYFLVGRIEVCLAQGGEKGRKDKDFIFWMLLLRKSYSLPYVLHPENQLQSLWAPWSSAWVTLWRLCALWGGISLVHTAVCMGVPHISYQTAELLVFSPKLHNGRK